MKRYGGALWRVRSRKRKALVIYFGDGEGEEMGCVKTTPAKGDDKKVTRSR